VNLKDKTWFKISLGTLAVVLYLILAFFSVTAGGMVAGLVALVWLLIMSFVMSMVMAIFTKKKEGFFVYGMTVFGILIIYQLVNLLITYVTSLVNVA